MKKFNENKYKQDYNREHYKRKEIVFKKEEWEQIETKLKKDNNSIKQIVLDYVDDKLKKEKID